MIFAFDAKGRPPQDMTIQVVTPVSFTVEYTDAPIAKIGEVEVHGMENCKAFSVTDNKETACTSQSAPQEAAARTPLRGLAKPVRSLISPPLATAPVGG
jgi:hypothetical protein